MSKLRKSARVWNLTKQFVCERKFRNRVWDAIAFHVRGAEAEEAKLPKEALADHSWLKGKRIYFVGGCELIYIKDALAALGAEIHHTFEQQGGTDALSETSNPDSPLWRYKPDCLVLSQTQLFRGLVEETQRKGPLVSRARQDGALDGIIENVAGALRDIRKVSAQPVFLITYPLAYRPVFGVHESRSIQKGYCLAELTRLYELKLYELAKRFPDVYPLDVGLALENRGKQGQIEESGADGVYESLTRAGALLVAERFLYQLAVLQPGLKRIKCAVFDLDGTLWAGVLREDGPGGIAVRESSLKILEHLAARGILLALCSKNDEAELSRLPEILGESLWKKLSVKKLNWQPKSQNLKAIASELNLGLDSLALFDNEPFERAEVQANAPEVLVLTERDILSSLTSREFEPYGSLTVEAASRTEKYADERIRAESLRESQGSLEDFLHKCELRLTLQRPAEGEISRVHEVLERTNQLNAALRRSTAADLRTYFARPDKFEIEAARLQDKFGDYGLIGVAVAEKQGAQWRLLELAFSCRALGRQVERALLNHLSRRALAGGATGVAIDFVPTERNGQMLKILSELGFSQVKITENGNLSLVRKLDEKGSDLSFPSWFDVIGAPAPGKTAPH